MRLNEATIPHYRSEIIPTEKLKKRISLNEDYLKEKYTWYEIDEKLQYFKIRNDFRLFTEQFFSIIGREIFGLDTLDYRVSYVRTIDHVVKSCDEKTQCGLLSDNFQEKGFNYYLVSELYKSEISDFVAYGGYSLKSLLAFFNDYLTFDSYKENELFLIRLFISDAYTHQEDRNHNNIGFKIPKIKGVPYNKRLHPEILRTSKCAEKHIEIKDNGQLLLKGLTPTKVYDSERSFGTDHKDVFTYYPGQIWCPLFPYSADTLFKTQEEALEIAEAYDGLDPNLFELYINHTDICKPIFERVAYDDEYRKLLERFKHRNSQIFLTPGEEERITNIIEDKREIFQRILKY